MKNLEQLRAAHALEYAKAGKNTRGQQGGNVLKKLPALVMGNGLLAAGAFAYAQKADSGWRTCFDYIAKHLAHPEIAITPGHDNLDKLMDFLSAKADSQTLKLATEESLAWLSYARRFEQAPPEAPGEILPHEEI
ncbi:MAG TPA: type III-B CRISPR module-associated protein Cmr5 [Candidatus Limnocylindria bacterium]|jgi:CRISPR/Cas system CMR-associated protein Cmr5 small subunit|nr:type III-B CRISPR module-associated protein Cmr5 [Candidatus Limnocylindria bacterium]